MEKFLKYLASFIVIFSFSTVVYAGRHNGSETNELSTAAAAEAMEKYRNNDFNGLKGCIYDPNNEMYTKSGIVKNGFIDSFKSEDLELTRGYATADKDGNMVFAGCYRGILNASKNNTAGTYFVFKIIASNGKNCKIIDNDIVVQDGVKYGPGLLNKSDGTPIGESMAIYDWVPEPDPTNYPECPKSFQLTANSTSYTSDKHKYLFTDDITKTNTGVVSAFGGDEYVTIPSTNVVEDKDEDKIVERCMKKAKENIEKLDCSTAFSTSIAGIVSKSLEDCIGTDADLNTRKNIENKVYSRNEELNKLAEQKINICQFEKCNVDYDKIKKNLEVNSTNGNFESCRNRKCPAYIKQSNAKNAKCYSYKIGISGDDVEYEWTDKPSKKPFEIEKNISKSECFATNKTKDKIKECTNCLKNLYKSSGLNEEQANCVIRLEEEKNSIINNMKNESEKASNKIINQKDEANKKIEEQRKENYVNFTTPKVPTEDPNLKTCEQVLGKNLTALLKAGITIIQIVGAIIAIVKGMMTLIPPILAKDADALKKASKTLTIMAIVLVVIFLLRPLLRFIGTVAGFDISCI